MVLLGLAGQAIFRRGRIEIEIAAAQALRLEPVDGLLLAVEALSLDIAVRVDRCQCPETSIRIADKRPQKCCRWMAVYLRAAFGEGGSTAVLLSRWATIIRRRGFA